MWAGLPQEQKNKFQRSSPVFDLAVELLDRQESDDRVLDDFCKAAVFETSEWWTIVGLKAHRKLEFEKGKETGLVHQKQRWNARGEEHHIHRDWKWDHPSISCTVLERIHFADHDLTHESQKGRPAFFQNIENRKPIRLCQWPRHSSHDYRHAWNWCRRDRQCR